MDWNQAIERAVSTESQIDALYLDVNLVSNLREAMIGIGNALDQVKKNTFYGREIILEDYDKYIAQAEKAIKVLKTIDPTDTSNNTIVSLNSRIFHSVIGIATEATELMEALNFEGKTLDLTNLYEETFDTFWYTCILHDAQHANMEQNFDRGFTKLEVRFKKGKFSADLANNRDLDSERKALEGIQVNS